MKQKIHVILIFILTIALLIISFVFAVNYKNQTANYFNESGYILSNNYESGSDNVSKFYFDAKTQYKLHRDNKYTFKNSDGDNVSVSNTNFVHYSNGSITALKKGVAIELNNIDSKLISYYNIFEGSTLMKKNEIYEINNLNDVITFSKLLYKLSKDKYLLAAPKIIVSFSDNQTVDMEDYVEIEYVNENVVRIYNDKVNYQTIASNLYLIIDNIKIDLEYKTISKKNVNYLTMADMIIDSDDNIEILPEIEDIIIEEETEKEETNNTQNNQGTLGNNNSGETNNGGNVDSSVQQGIDNLINNLPEQNEEIDTEDEFIQPKFKVDSMDVTTLGFENLSLSFEDESSVLYGNRVVEILENSTGKVVQRFDDWTEGVQNYAINYYFGLKPNTAYTLNVSGQYEIDETIYDRTFISKIFRTLDIGLEITPDYIASNSLSFAIYKSSYSKVNGFSYEIQDKNGNVIVEGENIRFENSDVAVITEEEKFNPNTEYVLILKDIKYGNDVFNTVSYEELKLTYKTKTLKPNPFRGSEVSLKNNVDSRKNTVSFSIEGINDLYGGIKNYTYNIYSSSDELLHTVTKDDLNDLIVSFEQLSDEDSVYFTVGINFDDNEKTIVFVSEKSNIISLSGVQYPKVVDYIKSEENEDCEKLAGEILLDDKSNFIASNNISYYKIDVKENTNSSLGGTQQYVGTVEIEYSKNDEQFMLPVYFTGLKPETEYVIYVYLLHNGKYMYLGYDKAITPKAQPVYLKFLKQQEKGDNTKLFDFQVLKNEEKHTSTVGKLHYINLDLYGCSKDGAVCRKLEHFATIPSTQDSTDLYNMLTYNIAVPVTSDDFKFYISNYNKEYDYKIVATGHSRNYQIPIVINNSETGEFKIEFNNIEPEINITPSKLLKDECNEGECIDSNDKNDSNINDETAIGYNFEINSIPNPMGEKVDKVYYSIYETQKDENGNYKKCNELPNELRFKHKEIEQQGEKIFVSFGSTLDDEKTFKRGKKYCVMYYGEYKKNNTGETLETAPQYKEFEEEKQRAEIMGYITEYSIDETQDNKEILKFNLDIKDPDNALVPGSMHLDDNDLDDNDLINANKENYESGDYQFVFPEEQKGESKQYSLFIKENIGKGDNLYKIYEVNLDAIIFEEIGVNIKKGELGDVIISLSNTNYKNRIAGLSIKKNGTNQEGYFDFDESGNIILGVNDIINNGYGTLNDKTLTFEEITLYYDSGKINSKAKQVFLKNKSQDKGYIIKENEKLVFRKNNSMKGVFSIDDLSSLISNKFVSNISSSIIGRVINDNEGTRSLIELNEVAKVKISNYKVDDVKRPISTSEFNIVYTSTGANVSFELKNQKIIDATTLEIVLDENNKKEFKYSGNTWVEQNSKGDKISEISYNKDTNRIAIKFINLGDSDYKFSLNYKVDESNFIPTYNDDEHKENTDIAISRLKQLPIVSKSAKKETLYWNWTNTSYNDIEFKDHIKNLFVVDTTKYTLSGNEEITYSIIATVTINNENEEIIIEKDIPLNSTEEGKSTNEELIYLYNKNLPEGDYIVKIKPKLDDIELEEFNLNSSPIKITRSEPFFEISSSGDPELNVEINDKDGILAACSDDALAKNDVKYNETDPMNYISEQAKKYYELKKEMSKVVYIELYSKYNKNDEDKFFYHGYSPIPFPNKSSKLDLTEYFKVNNLPVGYYKIVFKYCTIDDINNIKSKDSTEFYIYDSSRLNAKVITMPDSYILLLEEPDPTMKESIQRIVYQYQTPDGFVTRELNNLDDTTNINNNIEYTTSETVDGKTNYYLGLSTGGYLTHNISNLQINFYSGATEDTRIATYFK